MTRDAKFISLNKKLLVVVVLVSSIVTSVLTAIHFYYTYRSDIDNLNSSLNLVLDSGHGSIARSLWNLDKDQVKIHVDAILTVQSIQGVTVVDEDGAIYYQVEKESKSKATVYSRERELFFDDYSDKRIIGKLIVWGTDQKILNDLYEEMGIFFLSQLMKTSLVSFLLLLIFERMVTKHIGKLALFLRDFDPDAESDEFFEFEREIKAGDELEVLKGTINELIMRVMQENRAKDQQIKQHINEIEDQRAVSLNSARLASIGEMAGNIAHEINNPLTVLTVSSKKINDLLNDNSLDKDKISRFMEKITNNTERMSKVITSLKKISRDDKNIEFHETSIGEIVDTTMDICQFSMRNKGIKLELEYIGITPDFKFNCRETQVEQVLTNLVNNSVDAVKDFEDAWVKIEIKMKNDVILLSVIDSGKGIDEEVQRKMFDPFYTTKKVGEGTGLGLSISNTVAKDHGGEIYIDNNSENTKITMKLSSRL